MITSHPEPKCKRSCRQSDQGSIRRPELIRLLALIDQTRLSAGHCQQRFQVLKCLQETTAGHTGIRHKRITVQRIRHRQSHISMYCPKNGSKINRNHGVLKKTAHIRILIQEVIQLLSVRIERSPGPHFLRKCLQVRSFQRPSDLQLLLEHRLHHLVGYLCLNLHHGLSITELQRGKCLHILQLQVARKSHGQRKHRLIRKQIKRSKCHYLPLRLTHAGIVGSRRKALTFLLTKQAVGLSLQTCRIFPLRRSHDQESPVRPGSQHTAHQGPRRAVTFAHLVTQLLLSEEFHKLLQVVHILYTEQSPRIFRSGSHKYKYLIRKLQAASRRIFHQPVEHGFRLSQTLSQRAFQPGTDRSSLDIQQPRFPGHAVHIHGSNQSCICRKRLHITRTV